MRGRRDDPPPFQRVAREKNWGAWGLHAPIPRAQPEPHRSLQHAGTRPALPPRKERSCGQVESGSEWVRTHRAENLQVRHCRGGEEHRGSRKPARGAARAAPSAAGAAGVWSPCPARRPLAPGVHGPGRGQGSWPQHGRSSSSHSQQASDKEPFPPRVTQAFLSSGTFSAELFFGVALVPPWSARARARGPGLGAADARWGPSRT